jgi:nitrite reductase (NADH) small subunit
MDKKQVYLGPMNKVPLGQGHCFIVEQKEIAVFRTRSGEIYAIQNRCPHRQGPLADGIIDNCQVICPYHAQKFDLKTGENSEGNEGVQTFSVWEDNGKLMIELETTS